MFIVNNLRYTFFSYTMLNFGLERRYKGKTGNKRTWTWKRITNYRLGISTGLSAQPLPRICYYSAKSSFTVKYYLLSYLSRFELIYLVCIICMCTVQFVLSGKMSARSLKWTGLNSGWKPWIFKTLTFWLSRINFLKYQRRTTLDKKRVWDKWSDSFVS